MGSFRSPLRRYSLMRVFVSSTKKDLVAHRCAVRDELETLGLQLGRMETFGARPQHATEACLAEIEASELFVGIYAHRYGHIPADSDMSITEVEFDYAFNNHRPTFCFLVDEEYPWPEEFKEQEPGKTLLRKFKDKVERVVVRDSFTTPDVLARRVVSSIGRYLLADPRRHGALNVTQFARISLADAAAMVFVDVMRLTCVAGSDLARAANQGRYREFVDVADSHFSDFKVQVTRLGADPDLETITKSADVERGLGWAILRLRREASLDRTWHEFLGTLCGLAERINGLAESVSYDYYA